MSGRSFDPDYAAQIGERLRGLRLARGWSLTDAEEHSGVVGVTLGSWERGDRGVPVHKLAALAELYGVPVADLIPGAVEPERSDLPDELPAEMSLSRDRWGRYVLVIDGPQLHGTAVTSSPDIALAIAGAYASFRRDQEAEDAA
jgi:transcriptional regulator with XRE-family HTH domain